MLWKEFDNGNASAMAPLADWTSMRRSDHFVQFYESDAFLTDSVAEYILHGLELDAVCICIGTSEHNADILKALSGFGIDHEKAIDSGVLIICDARELLSKFMRKPTPDAKKFHATVGKLIKGAAAPNKAVRAFGEMVAVLWDEGRYEAAVRLEALWNELRDECDFSLFCAYPLKGFRRTGLNGELRQICDHHTKTIPAESYSSLTKPEERLRAIAYLQQCAEQLTAEIAELEARIASKAPSV